MRSRIATAAVAASLVAGLVAGLAACSTTSKAPAGGAPAGPSASSSTTAPGGGATSSAPVVPVAASSSATTAESGASGAQGTSAFTPAQLETMRAKVAAVYGQGYTTATSHYEQPDINRQELAADFTDKATMDALFGTGAIGSNRPMDCGTAKYNGIVLGAVQASGIAATIPVALYENSKAGAAEITVIVDPASGVIKSVACGGAPKPADFPGVAPLAGYYGAMASGNTAVLNDKSDPYFTRAFATWKPTATDYDVATCSQYVPDRWAVALTGTSPAASTWDFGPGAVSTLPNRSDPAAPTGLYASLAVDLGAAKIARVSCYTNPLPADPAHPATSVNRLMETYRLAADQKSLGVDPQAAIRSAFVSDAAFTTAWNSTGTVPLLCSSTVPGSVETADNSTGTTSGSKITFSMATWRQWHPDNPGQELSKFTLVVDASTLKIVSITCTK
ncbi:hypothetical protein [Catenulispora rubra]|uniref:hypothetical protein n=1 Tax=Catenulispora rubra TaxID=280293 RepID=UPI0018922DF3|nr:hypothetical protein [Catenulispora rubra]